MCYENTLLKSNKLFEKVITYKLIIISVLNIVIGKLKSLTYRQNYSLMFGKLKSWSKPYIFISFFGGQASQLSYLCVHTYIIKVMR